MSAPENNSETRAPSTASRRRFEGKRVLITGIADGQGRSHAVAFAREGADIIGVDIGEASATQKLVEAEGASFSFTQADVRDEDLMMQAIDRGCEQLGGLDIAVVNAGVVVGVGALWELTPAEWDTTVGVNLTGAFNTIRAVMPKLIDQGHGGSIVFTGSTAGVVGAPHVGHYSATKHALQGLMRTLAMEAASHSIRVNAVNPTTVDTPMVNGANFFSYLRPDLDDPTREDISATIAQGHALPVGWIEASDVTAAVLWLASEEARYVTGHALLVDAGATLGANVG